MKELRIDPDDETRRLIRCIDKTNSVGKLLQSMGLLMKNGNYEMIINIFLEQDEDEILMNNKLISYGLSACKHTKNIRYAAFIWIYFYMQNMIKPTQTHYLQILGVYQACNHTLSVNIDDKILSVHTIASQWINQYGTNKTSLQLADDKSVHGVLNAIMGLLLINGDRANIMNHFKIMIQQNIVPNNIQYGFKHPSIGMTSEEYMLFINMSKGKVYHFLSQKLLPPLDLPLI